jgi:hypothetical protein
MSRWTFRSYVENGVDQVEVWYNDQLPSVQAEFFDIVKDLRDLEFRYWDGDDYKTLQGKLDVLAELRIIIKEGWWKKIHYRVLGFLDVQKAEFTMLCADRKTHHFSYDSIGPLALQRRLNVLALPNQYSQIAKWIIDE